MTVCVGAFKLQNLGKYQAGFGLLSDLASTGSPELGTEAGAAGPGPPGPPSRQLLHRQRDGSRVARGLEGLCLLSLLLCPASP